MLATLRWLSGLRAGGVTPTGTCRHPVTAFRGSNRRSEDDSSGSPREAEHADLCRLLPQRRGGGWHSGEGGGCGRHEGVTDELWKLRSLVKMAWVSVSVRMSDKFRDCRRQVEIKIQNNRKESHPREHVANLSAFSRFLNLLYGYQPLLKHILCHAQTLKLKFGCFHFMLTCFHNLPETVFLSHVVFFCRQLHDQDTNKKHK